jgi:hypothetical protein
MGGEDKVPALRLQSNRRPGVGKSLQHPATIPDTAPARSPQTAART